MQCRIRKAATVYARILVPTDGSEFSRKAITAAVAFAKDAHPRVTGYFGANLADVSR